MASLGDKLTQPEVGWKRYDNTDSLIEYTGSGFVHLTNHEYSYNKTITYIPADGSVSSDEILQHRINFGFYGTNIRLFGSMSSTYSKQLCVTIDGVEKVSSVYSNSDKTQSLLFEAIGLERRVHNVEIKCLINVYKNLILF